MNEQTLAWLFITLLLGGLYFLVNHFFGSVWSNLLLITTIASVVVDLMYLKKHLINDTKEVNFPGGEEE